MHVIFTKKIISCVFLIGFILTSLNAQIGGPIVSSESKQIRSKATANTAAIHKKLAIQITRNSQSDLEKARAIFRWIATHIAYDNELRYDTQLQKQIYTSEKNVVIQVLKRRKALCGGYAFLFKELCAQLDIQSEVIHGFSKKYYSQSQVNKKPDHTWNSVKIDGTFYLLDLTLAVSHGQDNNPNMYWFRTSPNYFIKTHYPEDKRWTLLTNPISRVEFERLPTK